MVVNAHPLPVECLLFQNASAEPTILDITVKNQHLGLDLGHL